MRPLSRSWFVDVFVSASTWSRLGNTQVTTDFAGKVVRYFIMARHSGAASVFRVSPPGMVASLTYEFAPIVDEVSNQIAAFHGNMAISSKDSPAADFASSRFNSIASDNASRRFDISSSRVAPWQFTPGISSIQPIHHWPSCRITAVYPVADN